MEYPHYVTVDKEGRVLVSDSAGPYVYVYDEEGEFLFKFGGWGEGEGQLNRPHGICTDSLGRIFVADSGNDRVDMFDSSGEFLSHAIPDIKQPLAVAITRRGNLIVSNIVENGNSVVHVFKPNGKLLRTIGDQQGMEYPHYVTVDKEGRVLVSDSAGPYVYVYDEEGEFLFKFGGWGEGEGQLNRPHGICTDSLGRILVADSGNDRVDMFDSSGEFLSHAIPDIKQPLAVAITRRGNLVVSNSENVVTVYHN
uniref:SMP-30/Gluconolactonase/LRE-like region domain-containing protein n=1 Tax=Branchiostoma floridae TaxID=7739 RepID=C3YQH1_BRAFL|eukprot:XP_002601489.1 hypothetical protein BRAFLDRAFT_241726 [Branchiostoma floridae]